MECFGHDVLYDASDACDRDRAFADSVKIPEDRDALPEAIRPALFAGNAARLYSLEAR